MYKEVIRQRAEWINRVKMVMTTNNQDEEEIVKIIGNKKYQKEL